MLSLESRQGVRLCDGVTRREMLRVGGFGLGSLGGLTLPGMLRAAAAAAPEGAPSSSAEGRPPGFGKANGKKLELKEPIDYFLDYNTKDTVLTLHFTLPFKAPVKSKELNLEIYDPEYFIDFSFKDVKEPVALVGAPAACKLAVARPKELSVPPGQQLGEAFFNQLSAGENWGSQFANKISVKCP